MDVEAVVLADFIPEAETRLEIYHRLGRTSSLDALEDISAEFADRFGALPPAFTALLDWTRLRLLCREQGIAAVRAGPKAVAFTPRSGCTDSLARRLKTGRIVEERVLIPFEGQAAEHQLPLVLAMLSRNG
jgi:transcription-repair coupling factor (superfamily II helicase)